MSTRVARAIALLVILACRRHPALSLRLAGALLYGALAGALLHERPLVAGAVMTAVWVTAAWRLGAAAPRS